MDAVTASTDLRANSAPRSNDSYPTYHGLPALKPSLYGWTVAAYMFIGGLAASAQILATAADIFAPENTGVILTGRVLALAGAVLGAMLLIADLHTKQRFYNMLRIFRPTSPMSIGTYVLMSFGFWSLLALVTQLLSDPHWLTLVLGALASISAWFMTTYTASLLAATATPIWAAAPRSLAVRFASSAFATGAAALCLSALALYGKDGIARALGNIAVLALAAELFASISVEWICRAHGINGPLQGTLWGALHLVGVQGIGIVLPIGLLIFHDVTGSASKILPTIAALCILGGGFLMRGVVLYSGRESATRPQDYFRFASPDRSQEVEGL